MLTLRLSQATPSDPALEPIVRPGFNRLRPLLEKQTSPGTATSYNDMMIEMYAHLRAGCGVFGSWSNVPQTELGYDWPAWLARLHAAAVVAAGAKTESKWNEPPK